MKLRRLDGDYGRAGARRRSSFGIASKRSSRQFAMEPANSYPDSLIASLEVRAIRAIIPANGRATSHFVPSAISSSDSSMPSSTIEVSRHATKRPRATSLPDGTWSAHSLGLNDDTP
jgi:hypothetical protein